MSLLVFALALASAALADPCLVVYPDGETIYHYDVNEYFTVGPGDALYDPVYDRGGEVLIDINDNLIALNIYQAPGLAGFTPSIDGQEGYVISQSPFELVVDGFNNQPTTFVNVLLVFDLPAGCTEPILFVNDIPPSFDAGLGYYFPLGDIVAQTPTADGNNVSDTITVSVFFSSCESVRLWAFSDENFNLQRDGNECFTAFSHDTTVPVEQGTWGSIKAVYKQ